MPSTPLSDSPIYDQLMQEYAAKEAYDRFFTENVPVTPTFILSSGEIRETPADDS